ncbi:hypothetical protein H0H92_010689 [Tricholoma furcatifolium]|nr:hypothetical protein H0H92_010689 [Tricholoma furcatifolium]
MEEIRVKLLERSGADVGGKPANAEVFIIAVVICFDVVRTAHDPDQPSSLSFKASSPCPTIMMLLRQLPAGPVSISFPSLADSLPSNSSILLSLLASLVVLSFIRAACLYLRSNTGTQKQQQAQVQVQEKAADHVEESRKRSSWAWGLLRWDRLPSLPVSLTIPRNETNGVGVGMQEKRPLPQPWQPVRGRRGGPAFETPLPAIYQSSEPLSMAKMIMSRHTYRRPSSRPPARTVAPPAPIPVPPPVPSSSTPPPSPSIV